MVIAGQRGVAFGVKAAVGNSGHRVLAMVGARVPPPAGTVAVIVVSFTTLNTVAATLLLNRTPVTPVKAVPVIVTTVPTFPVVGMRLVTVAQAGPVPQPNV